MMFTLDLSGHDKNGKAGVQRYGGLFLTIEAAEAHGQRAATCDRLAFRPATLWVRNEENQIVSKTALLDYDSYNVTLTRMSGHDRTFKCSGTNDQQALIYAGKIVEAHADTADEAASVTVSKGGTKIGPVVTVGDMLNKGR